MAVASSMVLTRSLRNRYGMDTCRKVRDAVLNASRDRKWKVEGLCVAKLPKEPWLGQLGTSWPEYSQICCSTSVGRAGIVVLVKGW